MPTAFDTVFGNRRGTVPWHHALSVEGLMERLDPYLESFDQADYDRVFGALVTAVEQLKGGADVPQGKSFYLGKRHLQSTAGVHLDPMSVAAVVQTGLRGRALTLALLEHAGGFEPAPLLVDGVWRFTLSGGFPDRVAAQLVYVAATTPELLRDA